MLKKRSKIRQNLIKKGTKKLCQKFYSSATAVFKGRDESLDFIGLLEWKCRIYTLFTPLEDWIGIVRIGRREMNLTSFFLEFIM